ncbi:MAG: HAD hydrolase-like protein [Hyphomonadaceae bacterium]|jgi:phosphoglycolate phosphatase|nr:HAD hydrolase-like protein [Hyphomonadaceae bacterium]
MYVRPDLPDALPARSLAGWTLAFDLDGTLVDTAPDLVRVTNLIMQDLGLATVDLAPLRSITGQGAAALLQAAASHSGVVFDPEELARHRARFIDIYAADTFAASRPFDGLESSLSVLRDAGAVLCICTNKPRTLATKVLDGLQLNGWFSGLVCPEDTPAIKPDPVHLRTAVEGAGGSLAAAMMIGDTEIDLAAGRNVGIPVALASFGYSKTKASALGADAVFDHFDELPGLISALATKA